MSQIATDAAASTHDAPSRRRLLLGSAAMATTVVATGGVTDAATAARVYRVNPYRKTKVPTKAELHMMNRMGCGYSRRTWKQMRAAGGPQRWFEKQLAWRSVPDNRTTNALLSWFPTLTHSEPKKYENNRTNKHDGWEYARDLANYSKLRRMYSDRQVYENLVEFWSNHLHVPSRAEIAWVHRFGYDKVIRAHALGRFDEMLVAASLHPAMLLYLDNYKSVRNAPNENHGRELLELHTVGRTSGYTEAMVKDSAKILSGYTVDARATWKGFYDPSRHTTGPVEVLGFRDSNGSSNGAELTRRYLRYLAHHPATARTIARKLAVRFVSDDPSEALVTHLASVFQKSGTNIKATLKALVAHPDFARSAGRKVRTPVEDLVATVRVMQVTAKRPRSEAAFAHCITYVHQGMQLYQWPRPDGPPDRNSAWSSATRVLGSFRMHWHMIGGFYPSKDVVYKSPGSWLPQRRIRFDQYVDHLSRMLLGRGSTPATLKAAVEATGLHPATVLTRQHQITRHLGVRLLGVLLDSPVHMTR